MVELLERGKNARRGVILHPVHVRLRYGVIVGRRGRNNRTGRKRLRAVDRFVSRRGYLLIKSILQSSDVLNSVRMTCIGFTRKTLSKRRSSSITTKLRLGSQSRSIRYLRLKGKRSLISGIGTRIDLVSQTRGNLALGSKVSLLRVIRSGIKLSTKLSLGSRLRSREVLSTLSRSTAHYVQAFVVFVEDNLTFFSCVFSDRSRRASYLLFFNDILISH